MLRSLLFLLAFFPRSGARAQESPLPGLLARAAELRLAESDAWARLLHYRRGAWGSTRSEARGADFFLSSSGSGDPRAELEATLRAFFEAPEPDERKRQHAQCRFPARYAWLKERLSFDPRELPEQPCARFKAWRGAPDSLTLVYADAYLNNPSSMYGHTFLRLDERGREDGGLLDYSLNFAAQTDTQSGVLFALLGLTGGFPGRFSLLPYYMKVQEYNNLESRDLWEYRLDLGTRTVDMLLRHAWELGSAHFDYYFLTKNCSYQLLPLLEAADPSLRLSEKLPLQVVPADTVRLLRESGLAGPPRYRPSLVSRMLEGRKGLSKDELGLAAGLVQGREEGALEELSRLPPERQAAVLDSSLDLLRYRAGFKEKDAPETLRKEAGLLKRRSRLPPGSAPGDRTLKSPVEEGHETARWGFALGAGKDAAFEEFSIRPALHDTLALQRGYVPDSLLEMFGLRLRHDRRNGGIFVEEAAAVNIASFSPLDPWIRKASWKASSGLRSMPELGCRGARCLAAVLEGGSGLSWKPGGWSLLYAFLEAELSAGGVLEKGGRIGGGAAAGALLDFARAGRLRLESGHRDYLLGERKSRSSAKLEWCLSLGRDSELRVSLTRRTPYQEASVGLNRYF